MDPGQLDKRVAIYEPTASRGANGEAINTFALYATRWAKVEPLSGDEVMRLSVEMPARRNKFTMRYQSYLTEKYQLVWDSQTWNILSVTPLGMNEYHEILAEASQT